MKLIIPNKILDDIVSHVENELDSGRKSVLLESNVVGEFLSSSVSTKTTKQNDYIATSGNAGSGKVVKEDNDYIAASGNAGSGTVVKEDKAGFVLSFSTLEEIAGAISKCKKCALCNTRTQTVPGVGNGVSPEIMFIGEAPGADEDEQGLPFVGRAGQLLTKMISAMGFTREQVFIANILKCRPPQNRTPTPEEMVICIPWLKKQISLVKPKCIVALGSTAVKGLLNTTTVISQTRGKWHKFENIPCLPTFHPSYLLRYPTAKKDVWEDLKTVLSFLGRTPPPTAQTEKK